MITRLLISNIVTLMSTNKPSGYVGRFAPSPTGPLHFGSLVAAVGSYLRARSLGGLWLLRMEDLDPPREQPGAAESIIRTLEAHGMGWDGEVLYQSRRHERYHEVLEGLLRDGLAYRCDCSRKEQAQRGAALALPPGVYSGHCRARHVGAHERHAVRLLAEGQVDFEDQLQGPIAQLLEQEVGDFVLRRADGLYAYQLAVVVDDAEQAVSEVVRGSDLLDSTARQILLQRHLDLPQPAYLHLPVALNPQGQKLSKQSYAPAVEDSRPLPTLIQVLAFLGQRPPAELSDASLDEFWQWAIAHWSLDALPRRLGLPAPLADGGTAQ